MNSKKRDKLKTAQRIIQDAAAIVSEIIDKEQDSLDNYPENLQASDGYEKIEDAISNLEEAINDLESAEECLNNAESNIKKAIG